MRSLMCPLCQVAVLVTDEEFGEPVAAIPRWISVEQPPEPCEAEEYEVWLDDPIDDGDHSVHRVYALYIEERSLWEREPFVGWLDRDGNDLSDYGVLFYRTLPAPPVV